MTEGEGAKGRKMKERERSERGGGHKCHEGEKREGNK